MQTEAWLHFEAWQGPPSREAIGAALRAAGLDALEGVKSADGADVVGGGGPGTPDIPFGVVCFGAVDPPLEETVRRLSRAGSRPVVALAATQRLLDGNAYWRLLAAGATDVFAWDSCAQPSQQVAARFHRWWEVDEALAEAAIQKTLVGETAAWRSLLREIVEAAMFTDVPILLTGESGTGKELVARLIHRLDQRQAKGDLVVLDCTTVVPTLSGSEFFGHEKGAFTGAIAPRDGAFAMADRGTLFLDEVSELPLPLQAELLRVVQEGMYKRVGSNTWRRTSFRLVAATNRDLVQEEAAGRFRRDLYYRMAGWAFRLPSLRDRRGDIPLLARHFFREALPARPGLALDPAVEELLRRRDYPGNVRDLRQLIGRIAARHTGSGPITVGDVPPEDRPVDLLPAATEGSEGSEGSDGSDGDLEAAVRRALARGMTLKEVIQEAGDVAVSVAYAEAQGNLQQAARRLGVTDRALQLRRAAGRSSPPARQNGAVA